MDFGTYLTWMLDDFEYFAVYMIGGIILCAFIIMILYLITFAFWIVNKILLIKAYLYLDKLEEKAEIQFKEYLEKMSDNG